jgi:hypothetical protein
MLIDFKKARKDKELKKGFQDNHGRTWVRCHKNESGTIWNLEDGRQVLCRLKYPDEFNGIL